MKHMFLAVLFLHIIVKRKIHPLFYYSSSFKNTLSRDDQFQQNYLVVKFVVSFIGKYM